MTIVSETFKLCISIVEWSRLTQIPFENKSEHVLQSFIQIEIDWYSAHNK